MSTFQTLKARVLRPAQSNPNEKLNNVIVGSAAVSMSIRVTGIGLSYLANVLLSRTLGLQAYGQYAIVLGWALVLTIPARAGFDNSALRFATVYLEQGQTRALRGFIRFAVMFVAAMSFVIALGVLVSGRFLVPRQTAQLPWLSLLVASLALLGLFSVLLRTARRIFASQFYDQVLRPGMLILAIGAWALAGWKFNATTALALTAAAAMLSLGCLLIHFRNVYRPHLTDPGLETRRREWLSLSVPMLMLGAIQEIMNQLDVILLGALSDARQAGMFAAAWRLASLVPFVMVALAAVGGPLIASAYERRDFGELQSASRIIARIGFASAVLAAAMLASFGPWLMQLFGREFDAAYPVMLVLLLGGVVNAFTGVVAYLMTLTGHQREALAIFGGALILSVLLNLLLIPRYGAVGAAAASASATMAWNIVMVVYVRRSLGIDASAVALMPRASKSLEGRA